jgi:hypothetical protein
LGDNRPPASRPRDARSPTPTVHRPQSVGSGNLRRLFLIIAHRWRHPTTTSTKNVDPLTAPATAFLPAARFPEQIPSTVVASEPLGHPGDWRRLGGCPDYVAAPNGGGGRSRTRVRPSLRRFGSQSNRRYDASKAGRERRRGERSALCMYVCRGSQVLAVDAYVSRTRHMRRSTPLATRSAP